MTITLYFLFSLILTIFLPGPYFWYIWALIAIVVGIKKGSLTAAGWTMNIAGWINIGYLMSNLESIRIAEWIFDLATLHASNDSLLKIIVINCGWALILAKRYDWGIFVGCSPFFALGETVFLIVALCCVGMNYIQTKNGSSALRRLTFFTGILIIYYVIPRLVLYPEPIHRPFKFFITFSLPFLLVLIDALLYAVVKQKHKTAAVIGAWTSLLYTTLFGMSLIENILHTQMHSGLDIWIWEFEAIVLSLLVGISVSPLFYLKKIRDPRYEKLGIHPSSRWVPASARLGPPVLIHLITGFYIRMLFGILPLLAFFGAYFLIQWGSNPIFRVKWQWKVQYLYALFTLFLPNWCGKVQITTLPPLKSEAEKNAEIGLPNQKKASQDSFLNAYLTKTPIGVWISNRGLDFGFTTANRDLDVVEASNNTTATAISAKEPLITTTNTTSRVKNTAMNRGLVRELIFPAAIYSRPLPLFANLLCVLSNSALNLEIRLQWTQLPHAFRNPLFNAHFNEFRLKRFQEGEIKATLEEFWNAQDLFALRVLVCYPLAVDSRIDREKVGQEVLSVEQSILSGLQNARGEQCQFKTLNWLQKIILENGRMSHGFLVSRPLVDFTFQAHFGIKRALRPIPEHFQEFSGDRTILLGNKLVGSHSSPIEARFPVDNWISHGLILGISRYGKTSFVANCLRQLKVMGIPQIIIGLKHRHEVQDFPFADIYVNRENAALEIPWIIDPNQKQDYYKVAMYLGAAMGLLDNGVRYIKQILVDHHKTETKIPGLLSEFAPMILRYLNEEENQYGESQGDIYQAIRQRVLNLISDDLFCERTRATPELPGVFQDFFADTSGKTFFIDLSAFAKYEQAFLVLMFLRILMDHKKPARENMLERVVVIDEAHKIFYKPAEKEENDAESVVQKSINSVLKELINEIAFTGTGLLFSDQNGAELMDCICTQTATKVFFEINREDAKRFYDEPEAIAFLTHQPKYQAFIQFAQFQYLFKALPPLPKNDVFFDHGSVSELAEGDDSVYTIKDDPDVTIDFLDDDDRTEYIEAMQSLFSHLAQQSTFLFSSDDDDGGQIEQKLGRILARYQGLAEYLQLDGLKHAIIQALPHLTHPYTLPFDEFEPLLLSIFEQFEQNQPTIQAHFTELELINVEFSPLNPHLGD